MISHKHKFIFIHIPKTGGTSIERCFSERDIIFKKKHLTVTDYEKKLNSDIVDYLKFSVIRNPWDRMVSYWKYRQNKPWAPIDGKLTEFHKWLEFTSSLDLNNLGGGQGNINAVNIPKVALDTQFNSLKNSRGDIQVELIRFENLQEDFNTICDKIGIPQQQLPHANKSKHKHYTEYYDDETKQLVAEKYARDIEYFGYKFGE